MSGCCRHPFPFLSEASSSQPAVNGWSRAASSVLILVLGLAWVAVTAWADDPPSAASPRENNPFPADQDGEDGDWIDLSDLSAWKPPTGTWFTAADAGLNPDNRRLLVGLESPASPGQSNAKPVLINGPIGRTHNLVSRRNFQDVEVDLEFMVSERSNSGVKLMGLYEIQIYDSFEKPDDQLKGFDNGGIYPRALMTPRYHHIDEGYRPKVNASRAPGQWQTLTIRFRAPRFDAKGTKTKCAVFERVTLNGVVVQENVQMELPTGHAHVARKEVAEGPILLQADHGPVAFRNIRARPLPPIETSR